MGESVGTLPSEKNSTILQASPAATTPQTPRPQLLVLLTYEEGLVSKQTVWKTLSIAINRPMRPMGPWRALLEQPSCLCLRNIPSATSRRARSYCIEPEDVCLGHLHHG